MKVGDWVRFNYSGLVGMVTHVDEHDCTVQLNGGYRKVLSRGEVQVIEPTEPARTEAHMDKQERDRLRAMTDVLKTLLDALDAAEQRAERLAAAIRNFRSAPRGDDAARFAALYAALAGEQTGEGGGAP